MELLDLPRQLSGPARVVTEGRAEIGFAVRDGATRLKHLFQHDPLRVLFPLVPAGDVPLAALVTTSGGLVGGDRLDIVGTVGAGARACIAPQAAEKVYGSLGATTTVEIRLEAGRDGWLEYLPMETILFDRARFARRCRVEAAPGARVMAGEILVFGRLARGEVMTTGAVRDAIEVRRDGRLVWADAFDPRGRLDVLDHPAGLGGARVLATLVYVGDDATALLDPVRELQALHQPTVRAGATVIGPVLVARWLAADGIALRPAYATVWQAVRARAGGLPAALPRLWHV